MSGGYLDFTAGSVLTAAQLEQYCELQGILRFASAAARNSALSAVLEEGLFAYLVDTNTLTVYTGSAWSTVGPVHGALTSYTPTVTQSGAVTCTVNTSTYTRIGRRILWNFLLTMTGTGTAANVVTLSLPAAPATTSSAAFCGFATLFDTSATTVYFGACTTTSSTELKFNANDNGGAVSYSFLGTSKFTAALASGDIIGGFVSYEAAADA